MKITRQGKDIIRLTDTNIKILEVPDDKVHLIRLDLDEPTLQKLDYITEFYNKTNRYIVDVKNVRFYNRYFKNTCIKYYVINTEEYYTGLISFFKRNNKVLLDTTILDDTTKSYIFSPDVFMDILGNIEVIIIDEFIYDTLEDILNKWNGNVIIHNEDYII